MEIISVNKEINWNDEMIEFNRDVVTNKKLTATDFTTYIKLVQLAKYIGKNEFEINHVMLIKSLGIKDNRTFKRNLHNLYKNKLIANDIDKLPTRGNLHINVKPNKENIVQIPEKFIFDIDKIGHLGLRILSLIHTSDEQLNYKLIHFLLGVDYETLIRYMKVLNEIEEYSKLINLKVKYRENIEIPSHVLKEIEVKNIEEHLKEEELEKYLINHIGIIEKGMKFIDNQVKVDNGFIDILAKDKNNKLCIIELKIRDNDKSLIFQCAYYPTQFEEDVRMIAITPNYTQKLINSLQSLGYVEMKTYKETDNGFTISDFN